MKARIAPLPAVSLYNRGGVCIGGFANELWAHKEWTFLNGNTTCHKANGFFGGGQIGANWQFANDGAIGAQFDWGWTNADSRIPRTPWATNVKTLGSLTRP